MLNVSSQVTQSFYSLSLDLFLALLVLSTPDSSLTLGLAHLLNLPSASICLQAACAYISNSCWLFYEDSR